MPLDFSNLPPNLKAVNAVILKKNGIMYGDGYNSDGIAMYAKKPKGNGIIPLSRLLVKKTTTEFFDVEFDDLVYANENTENAEIRVTCLYSSPTEKWIAISYAKIQRQYDPSPNELKLCKIYCKVLRVTPIQTTVYNVDDSNPVLGSLTVFTATSRVPIPQPIFFWGADNVLCIGFTSVRGVFNTQGQLQGALPNNMFVSMFSENGFEYAGTREPFNVATPEDITPVGISTGQMKFAYPPLVTGSTPDETATYYSVRASIGSGNYYRYWINAQNSGQIIPPNGINSGAAFVGNNVPFYNKHTSRVDITSAKGELHRNADVEFTTPKYENAVGHFDYESPYAIINSGVYFHNEENNTFFSTASIERSQGLEGRWGVGVGYWRWVNVPAPTYISTYLWNSIGYFVTYPKTVDLTDDAQRYVWIYSVEVNPEKTTKLDINLISGDINTGTYAAPKRVAYIVYREKVLLSVGQTGGINREDFLLSGKTFSKGSPWEKFKEYLIGAYPGSNDEDLYKRLFQSFNARINLNFQGFWRVATGPAANQIMSGGPCTMETRLRVVDIQI